MFAFLKNIVTGNLRFLAGCLSLGVFAALLLFFSPNGKHVRAEHSPIVRVRIARDFKQAEVCSTEKCYVTVVREKKIPPVSIDMRAGDQVTLSGGKIKVGGNIFPGDSILISPANDAGFSFNGVEYRGELEIAVTGGALYAVNHVDVESYLLGVIPREVYHFWPISALRAQAVASRSYAIYEASRRSKRAYDLTSDIYSQVYGGRTAERPRTTKAAEDTRGQVMVYEGKLVPGYFHASCGGHTTRISKVWRGPDSEVFKGVRSPYCRWSPSYRWRTRMSDAAILERLNSSGYEFDAMDDLRTGSYDTSGRAEYVRVRSGGNWFDIPIRDFTAAIGVSVLRSSNFRTKKYPLFYAFSGYGWGHGIGMCQWCAFGLSLRRWDHERILKHFFRGVEITYLEKM